MTDNIEDTSEEEYAAHMAEVYAHEQHELTPEEEKAMDEMNILCQAAQDKAEAAMIIACEMDPAVEGLRELSWAYIEYGELTVDPEALVISPSTVENKTVAQVAVLLRHEWGHIKLGHLARWRALRDKINDPVNYDVWHKAWNFAADFEINSALIHEFVKTGLQEDGLVPGYGKYASVPLGLTAEAYIDLIRATPALWENVERRAGRKLKPKADISASP